MITSRSRNVAIAGAVATAGLAAAIALVALPAPQGADIAVPADGASAEEVVRAYIDALDAHDCDTAAAVTAPEALDATERWCDRVAGLGSVEVGAAVAEDPAWSGRAAGVEAVHVPVTFDLDWRLLKDDGSLPEGRTTWGYLLVRDDGEAPWRIADHGVG